MLRKSLYGLKQAGRLWNNYLSNALIKIGFRPAIADPCVYLGEAGAMMLIHVDDVLILAQSEAQVKHTISKLKEMFSLKELGEVRNYLGVQIERTDRGYLWHQQEKVEQLLEAYGMQNCKGAATPMVMDFGKGGLSQSPPCHVDQYQPTIGHLLYLAQWSRPDIACAVNVLSRSVSDPRQAHWEAVKSVSLP